MPTWWRTTVGAGASSPEYELLDTGVFAENRYFDVEVEYAKAGPEDMLIRITATNRGPDAAPLHLLPTLWFRNTWSWGSDDRKPRLRVVDTAPADGADGRLIHAAHHALGEYWLACEGTPELLFTENETNTPAALERAERRSLRQGRHQRCRRARRHRRGEPRGHRHQGGGALPRSWSRPVRPSR